MRPISIIRDKNGFTATERIIVIGISLLLGLIVFAVGHSAVAKAHEMQGYSVLRLANIAATSAYIEMESSGALKPEDGLVLSYPLWYDEDAVPENMRKFALLFEKYVDDEDALERLTLTVRSTENPESPDIQIRYYASGRGSKSYLLSQNGKISEATSSSEATFGPGVSGTDTSSMISSLLEYANGTAVSSEE